MTVTVGGDVENTVVLSVDDLSAMPAQTATVSFQTAHGIEQHDYIGTPLDAVISAARPDGGGPENHPLLTVAVIATGVDGYSAALSWGEISPKLSPRPPLVAWSEDGRRLERPRLVLPGDVGGARYVRDLVSVQLAQLAAR